MAIEFTQERFYPSVRKPGVFLIDPEENSELWEQLTGIDNAAIDRFKFSLGSWVEVNKEKQKIILYPTALIDDESFENIKNNLVGTVFGDVPRDIFVGIPIVSTQSDLEINKDDLSFLTKDILPIYHDKESSDYSSTTAPLTIQFGVNYFQRLNPNEENILDIGASAVILPSLNFESDVLFLDKTEAIFSNFDWYNDTPWKGGGGQFGEETEKPPGFQDDVIANIEGHEGNNAVERVRDVWQDTYLNTWHRFEYALPTFTGRHEMTQKYVDARGTDDDVGGRIVYSKGDKIGVSLDSADPYSGGTADNISNNFLGVNLEDIIGITMDNMGAQSPQNPNGFNPGHYSSTGNMTSKAANVDSTQGDRFIELKRHRRNTEDKVHQLYLKFHDDVYCPLDVRVGDKVAFNIIDRRNEVRLGNNTENVLLKGNYEHHIHRGRRISRPPLGVGRQFEYIVNGLEFKDGGSGMEERICIDAIWLDAFILGFGHLSSGTGKWEVLTNFYTNDILLGPENGLSNADIIQIYRPEEDFDEDENSIPSIAHKDKLYIEYDYVDSNQDPQYSVSTNPEKMIRFNTHANNGLALQNSYFKDMPVVDDFMYDHGDQNQSERDKLVESRQGVDALYDDASGKHRILYAETEEETQYTKNGQIDSLLRVDSGTERGTGVYPDDKRDSSGGGSGHIYSDLDRLENLYDSKATISNVSANMEHYSYDFANHRHNRVRGFGDELGDKGANAMREEGNQRGAISDWIAIASYNSSEPRTRLTDNSGPIGIQGYNITVHDHADKVEQTDGTVFAAKNEVPVNLDEAGGYDFGVGERSGLLPESGKNYRSNLVFQTRRPCDFFIKFRMNKSGDFENTVLSTQADENPDYNDRINSNGYVKISKGKFYQIIPDIVVYNSKSRPVIMTIGVGAKVKGISDKNYLNSYRERTFLLYDTPSESGRTRRLGGINRAANGTDIRITHAGFRSGGRNLHLTSKYFTATQEDQLVMPFIRLSFHNFTDTLTSRSKADHGNRIFYNVGHIDMIELPYDFNAGSTTQTLIDNYVKYHVLDWGDGPEPMTEDKIRQTEFFSIYDQEPDDIDKFQVKNLMQTVDIAKPIYENGVLNLTSHTYTEPGVKNIKTLIFKLDTAGTAIYETILLNTSIVVNSVSTLLQDFNTFGASEFNVLPLSNTNKELIVGGGISSDSNYVSSLSAIDTSNAYGSDDFIEKEYYDSFKKSLDSGSYGENMNLDLSTVRFFDKPKSLFDFITNDIDELIESNFSIQNLPTNSSATDIFINSVDCKFELGMNDANGILMENTSNSNESGILIGDYSLIKEEGEDIKKEDEMDIPEFERDSTKQAF